MSDVVNATVGGRARLPPGRQRGAGGPVRHRAVWNNGHCESPSRTRTRTRTRKRITWCHRRQPCWVEIMQRSAQRRNMPLPVAEPLGECRRNCSASPKRIACIPRAARARALRTYAARTRLSTFLPLACLPAVCLHLSHMQGAGKRGMKLTAASCATILGSRAVATGASAHTPDQTLSQIATHPSKLTSHQQVLCGPRSRVTQQKYCHEDTRRINTAPC